MLLSVDLLSIDEASIVEGHGQRSSWHSHHAVQVVIHVEYLLLLRVQIVGLVGLSLVYHCEPHVSRHKDVVSVTLRRCHGCLDVVAVICTFDLRELS